MGPHNYVKTIVRCRSHRCQSPEFCLRVDVEVSKPLRCPPGGGGGSGGSTLGGLGPCPCGQRLDIKELQRRVQELLHRGRGEWIHAGAVIVDL
jgi:hypothetical protein